jgi:hypothetical protein
VTYLEKLVKNPVLVATFNTAPLGMVGNVAGIRIGSKKQAQNFFGDVSYQLLAIRNRWAEEKIGGDYG